MAEERGPQDLANAVDGLISKARSWFNSSDQTFTEAARLLGIPPPSERTVFQARKLAGTVGQRQIQIRETSTQNTKGISYVVVHSPLGIGLRIRRQSRMGKVVGFGGSADDLFQDSAFGEQFRIDTNAPEVMQALLTPDVRAQLTRLIDRYPTLEVGETQISVQENSRPESATQIVATINELIDLSWAIVGSVSPDGVVSPAPPPMTPQPMAPPAPPTKPSPPPPTAMAPVEPSRAASPPSPHVRPPRIVVPDVLAPERTPPPPGRPTIGVPAPRPPVSDDADDPAQDPVAGDAHEIHDDALAEVDASDDHEAPVEDEPAAEPTAAPQVATPDPVVPGRAAIPGDQLEQLTAIFASGPLRSRASFDREFAGRPVMWTGAIRSAVEFQSDVHFGRVEGVKATLAVGEITVPGFGTLMIEAVVHLPEGTELRAGDDATFRGVLLKLDGLTRDIYVANGSLA